jgi:hypothetical protein
MKTKGKYANPQRERIDPLWVKQTQLIAATFLHQLLNLPMEPSSLLQWMTRVTMLVHCLPMTQNVLFYLEYKE